MTVVQFLQETPAFAVGALFVVGLLVGSFLNVVIYRLPIMMEREWRRQCEELAAEETTPHSKEDGIKKEGGKSATFNLVVPRSACPSCKAPITALQNVPVLSWLVLRGKCAKCKTSISVRYPIVELLTGILSAAVVWRFGLDWNTLAGLVLTWSLIALTFIDIDHQLLPDSITLPLLWLGLLFSLTYVSSGDSSLVHAGSRMLSIPTDLRSSVIGAAAGYLSLWSVYHLFKLLTGKEGMGYGDFKLLAVFGAWFGWQMLLPIILLSAFTGAIIGSALLIAQRKGRSTPIPFGPYLAAAGWIALMWGPEIVDRYLHLFSKSG